MNSDIIFPYILVYILYSVKHSAITPAGLVPLYILQAVC